MGGLSKSGQWRVKDEAEAPRPALPTGLDKHTVRRRLIAVPSSEHAIPVHRARGAYAAGPGAGPTRADAHCRSPLLSVLGGIGDEVDHGRGGLSEETQRPGPDALEQACTKTCNSLI